MAEHAGELLTIQRVAPIETRGLVVRCPAIQDDGRIDPRFSADGENTSPALSWTAIPEADSYAVIVEDPDAPGDAPWIHWMIWNIPGTADGLAEDIAGKPRPDAPAGAVQGKNGASRYGWFGPKPPPGHGVHHYHFQVFALTQPLNADPEAGLPELVNRLKALTLASGEVVGTFETPG